MELCSTILVPTLELEALLHLLGFLKVAVDLNTF